MAMEGGGKPSAGLALKQKLFSKLVYSKLHDALGGECNRIISGGGPALRIDFSGGPAFLPGPFPPEPDFRRSGRQVGLPGWRGT